MKWTFDLNELDLSLFGALRSRWHMSPDAALSRLILYAASLTFTHDELYLMFGKQYVIDVMMWEES